MKKSQLKIELRSEDIFPNGFSLEDFERSFEENQNILISGMSKQNEQIIKWEIIKL